MQTDYQDSHAKLLSMVTYASVTVAIILVILKFWATLATGSLSILASLVDSIMDTIASVITLIAVYFSLKPADEDHRFGHGKAEPLAALVQSAFIFGSAFFLLIRSTERIIQPQALQHTDVGLIVMLISIVLTILLVAFQKVVIKKTNSTAIKADSLHYITDLLTNVAILLAVWFAAQGYWLVDSITGLCIAFFIMHSAWKIARESVLLLMDTELDQQIKDQIIYVIQSHAEVMGLHELRTRHSGRHPIIQFHLELNGGLSLHEAHRIAVEIERQLHDLLPGADIIIHQDPADIREANETYDDVDAIKSRE